MRVINWWDFEFDRIDWPALSSGGTPYLRRVSYGMPRIGAEILSSPFYLYHSVEDAKEGKRFGGTGFFVAYPFPLHIPGAGYPAFLYAVTNWHVAVRDGMSVMRINKINGGVDILEFDPSEWEFLPQGPDIAVIGPERLLGLKEEIHDIVAIHISMFLGRQDINALKIGPGEDVFMLGRFVDHDGAASNVPAARFGNISVMPQPFPQPTGARHLTSYVLDVHSRTGYSGSPVFVYRTVFSDLTAGPGLVEAGPHTHFIRLLGVHWGQFPEHWEIKSKDAPSAETALIEGDEKYIEGMSGMTLALPAWQLKDFLDMKKFADVRNKFIKQAQEERGIGPKTESASPPATDANPKHREDFNFLVGAAARKREQED